MAGDGRAHRGAREEHAQYRVGRQPGQRHGEGDEDVGQNREIGEQADCRLDQGDVGLASDQRATTNQTIALAATRNQSRMSPLP